MEEMGRARPALGRIWQHCAQREKLGVGDRDFVKNRNVKSKRHLSGLERSWEYFFGFSPNL